MIDMKLGITNRINVPLSPLMVSEDGKVTCKNCKCEFFKAKRCTYCGQLIRYSDIEIISKKQAKQFLDDIGIVLDEQFSYVKRQDNKEQFWLNPQTSVVGQDWILVLNNQVESKITIVRVPADTFIIRDKLDYGFKVRKDKPHQIDLEINSSSFIDERSKYDFKPYIEQEIFYNN